ncbi:integrase, partial [human gut metagenome]
MKEITLQEMLSTIIGELRENGRWGTAHIYQSTLNVFSAFNNYRDLHLRKLNPVVLKRFEMHLRQRDCSWNTVSTYMKVIRSAYNRAVDLRCVRYTPRLFEHVYTGTKADKKRALEASDIGNFSSRDRNGFVQKDSFLKPSKGQNAICFYVYDAWSPICRFSFLA